MKSEEAILTSEIRMEAPYYYKEFKRVFPTTLVLPTLLGISPDRIFVSTVRINKLKQVYASRFFLYFNTFIPLKKTKFTEPK